MNLRNESFGKGRKQSEKSYPFFDTNLRSFEQVPVVVKWIGECCLRNVVK